MDRAEVIFPKLLNSLCKDNPRDALSHQQALAKQMADVLDFVLLFDNLKVWRWVRRVSLVLFAGGSLVPSRALARGGG
jgi:hypothetical protein